MTDDAGRDLERRIAALLRVGTWIASAIITVGLILPAGATIVSGGIALFIALPILRVAVASFELLRRGDLRIGAISLLVLAIIALGIAVGLRGRGAALSSSASEHQLHVPVERSVHTPPEHEANVSQVLPSASGTHG